MEDCSSTGSSVHGILQARKLEWVAAPSSRGSSWPRDQTMPLSSPALAGRLFTTEPAGKPHDSISTLLYVVKDVSAELEKGPVFYYQEVIGRLSNAV